MKRRQLLKWSAAAACGPLVGRGEGAGPGVTFFLASDTHYHALEESPGEMDPRSVAVNGRLVDQMNRLPGTEIPAEAGGGVVPEPAGVIHGGDIIDSGDKNGAKYVAMQATELAAFVRDWGTDGKDGRLKWACREVHGNHDGPQGQGAMMELLAERNRRRSGLAAVSANGLHCAWDWGGVHFLNLGIVVGQTGGVPRRRRYAPMESLAFLVEQLAAVPVEKPLVITHHVDMMRYAAEVEEKKVLTHEWDYADVRAYWEAIRGRRVAAVLYGHTHGRNVFRWDGGSRPAAEGAAAVPVFNADNSAHFKDKRQALTMVTVDGAGTTFREFATVDAWETGVWTPQVWRFPARGG